MTTARELLNERRWTGDESDEFIGAFIRNLVLPLCKPARKAIASDAAPTNLIPEPDSWMTVIPVDQSAMVKASREGRFFEGVSWDVGKARRDAYLLRHFEGGER
jgi:hypothetical protein